MRYFDGSGAPVADMIVDDSVARGDASTIVDVVDDLTSYDVSGAESRELLVQLVERGRRLGPDEDIERAKSRCREALSSLDVAHRRFLNPQTYPVGLEMGLAALRSDLTRRERLGSGRSSK